MVQKANEISRGSSITERVWCVLRARCEVWSGVRCGYRSGCRGCVDVGGGSELLPRVEHSSTGQEVSIEVNVVMEVEVSKPSSAVQAQVFGSVGVRNDSSNSPSMVRQ